MINIQSDLDNQLLKQNFVRESESEQLQLEQCQAIAKAFVKLENGIAVLSDLKHNKSYIYIGQIAKKLNIFRNNDSMEIESIWEKELFDILKPEDVLRKHLLELQFFQFIKTVPLDKRKDYCIISKLRLSDNRKSLVHKMFYFSDLKCKNVELALCLYRFDSLCPSDYEGRIVDTSDGTIVQQIETTHRNFLSVREKEILKMIQSGKKSKDIADLLFISIYTVNRHRQNILRRMRVSNMAEACTIAARLKWI